MIEAATPIAEVREHYATLSPLYQAAWGDSLHFGIFPPGVADRGTGAALLTRQVAAELAVSSGQHVLDVGCGPGGSARVLANATGADVVALDLLEAHAVSSGRPGREPGRVHGLVGDAQRLPLTDASVDHVVSFEAGCHMADKAAFYAECHRVLKPGGAFAGTDWLCTASTETSEQIRAVCEAFACPGLLTLQALHRALEHAGFLVDVVEDLTALGNVGPNWAPLTPAEQGRLGAALATAPPAAVDRLLSASFALTAAVRAGAFVVGHWRARRRRASAMIPAADPG